MGFFDIFSNMLNSKGAGDAASAAATTQAGQTSTALGMQGGIVGNLIGGFSAVSNMFDIKNNPSMNKVQKQMGTADSGVDAVAAGLSFIPGFGTAAGTALKLINNIGGSFVKDPTKNYSENKAVTGSSAFGGVADNAMDVTATKESFGNSGLAGKLTGKKGLKQKANESMRQQSQTATILDQNNMAKANSASADLFNTRTQFKQSGSTFNNMRMGKEGLKLEAAAFMKKFQSGGTIDKNVILTGALHARKHSLKENKEYEDAAITNKGIPVITKSEGGDIVQHAEVESQEIVLHHKLTKELEELYENGSEEAMIKAGKLLAKELLKNTKDKAKIINQIN